MHFKGKWTITHVGGGIKLDANGHVLRISPEKITFINAYSTFNRVHRLSLANFEIQTK